MTRRIDFKWIANVTSGTLRGTNQKLMHCASSWGLHHRPLSLYLTCARFVPLILLVTCLMSLICVPRFTVFVSPFIGLPVLLLIWISRYNRTLNLNFKIRDPNYPSFWNPYSIISYWHFPSHLHPHSNNHHSLLLCRAFYFNCLCSFESLLS